MKKIIFFVIVCLFLFPVDVVAQRTTDIEGSEDHPVISRFEGAVIEFYEETDWGEYRLPIDDEGNLDWQAPKSVGGKVTRIQYSATNDYNADFFLHNYKTAFEDAGYEILIAIAHGELGFSHRPHTWHDNYYFSGLDGRGDGLNNIRFGRGLRFPIRNDNHSYIAARGRDAGQDIYVAVYSIVGRDFTLITQDVIEVDRIGTGMVSVETISEDIERLGSIALYDINFATAEAEIQSGSDQILQTIADYINANPGKQYFIVGHTDSRGEFEFNMNLSENRASAVLDELVDNYGVDRAQLEAYGVSSLAPVASNSTKTGRSRNRRVEIVER